MPVNPALSQGDEINFGLVRPAALDLWKSLLAKLSWPEGVRRMAWTQFSRHPLSVSGRIRSEVGDENRGVFVSCGCDPEYPRPRGLNSRNVLPRTSRSWKSEIKMLAGLSPSEGCEEESVPRFSLSFSWFASSLWHSFGIPRLPSVCLHVHMAFFCKCDDSRFPLCKSSSCCSYWIRDPPSPRMTSS